MIGTVDFSGDNLSEMYYALKNTLDPDNKNYNENTEKYLFFDDQNRKVWVMWGLL